MIYLGGILETFKTVSIENEIPEWVKKGVLTEKTDPQPAVRKNAETNKEWEFQPVADKIYPKVEIIKQRLFDGVLTPERTSPLLQSPLRR